MGKFFKAVDNFFRNSVSPIFVLMLFVSFALWYISKLDYDYTTNIPVRVNLDGYRFKVECTAEGRGSALMAHRFNMVDKTKLSFSRILHAPLAADSCEIVLSPSSLMNAIATTYPEIRIISIGIVPNIRIDQQEVVAE
ncbi:MAG: hypothetical protein IIU85_05295 [Rikenellaceae bacterium]|jgi:hypothetical protein|nr:hypothetical protein [Rikenellaceae bacterium]